MAFLDSKSTGSSRGSYAIHGFFFGFCHGRRPHEALGAGTSSAGHRGFGQAHRATPHPASSARHSARPGHTRPGSLPSLDERVAAVVSRLAPGNPGPLDHQRLASLFETVIRLTEPLCSTACGQEWRGKKGLTSSGGYLTVPASLLVIAEEIIQLDMPRQLGPSCEMADVDREHRSGRRSTGVGQVQEMRFDGAGEKEGKACR